MSPAALEYGCKITWVLIALPVGNVPRLVILLPLLVFFTLSRMTADVTGMFVNAALSVRHGSPIVPSPPLPGSGPGSVPPV